MQNTTNKSAGIIAGGNWIVDHLKVIDSYPVEEALANIVEESFSNGGSAYNVLKNLAMLQAAFPLKGIGLVGDDEYGRQIHRDCQKRGIDANDIAIRPHIQTSYTDVMVVRGSGRRTFFHNRGANAFLDIDHFDFRQIQGKIFHLGYLLLLDRLDHVSEDGTTGAARVLEMASAAGLKTSVDLVSEDGSRFKKIVRPSLSFVDYLFLNEFETTRCTGVTLNSHCPDYDALDKAATIILDQGVREWVFIHFPDGVFAKSKNGEVLQQGALDLPLEKVKSASGAGDALAAGILYGIHEGWQISDALRLGVWTAACCIQELSCSDGILPVNEYLKFQHTYRYKAVGVPQ